MDEIWRHFAWILGTGGAGAAVGCAFGAVTGCVHGSEGRAAGTFVAHRVVGAFESVGDKAMSPRQRGTLVGATDGFLFLGIIGTVLGVVFAYVGRPDDEVLIIGAIGGALLVLAALFFGMLAYAIVRNGVWAVVGMFFGGMGGGFVEALLRGRVNVMVGVVVGMVAGVAASFLLRRYTPHYRAPGVAKGIHDDWRRTGDDIQSEPPQRGSEAIQKAPPSEE